MALQMIGIDYEKADLDTRALFAFQPHVAEEGMLYLKEQCGFLGAVILSTCNRTEIYVSSHEPVKNLTEIICDMKKVSSQEYEKYMTVRQEEEAIHHLFLLACGMKSKVFGEDQIITQVKTALLQAREAQATDAILEKLFQEAITAAKRVKAEVHLTAIKTSVIEQMKQALYDCYDSLEGRNCLVIGNGEIGRLAASSMVEEKSNVTVTVRSYKTRNVEIPMGCKVVDYQDRFLHISDSEIIISATTSPHHTIKYEETIHFFQDGKHRVLVDLAVPRDISSRFSTEDCVTLYDIDTLGGISNTAKDNKAMAKALEIIKEYEDKFYEDMALKGYVATIQTIGMTGANVCYKRIKKQLGKVVEQSEQDKVEELVIQGTQKTMQSMLFGMKEHLTKEQWKACLDAMKRTLEEQEY